MSEENSLIEIPRSDWTRLRDLYVNKDTDPHGHLCINNFIKWVKKDPDLKVTFLSLNGDWQNDGTFVLTVDFGTPLKHLYFNTLGDSLDRVIRALECLDSFEKKYIFFGFSSRMKPAVDHIGRKYYSNKELLVDETICFSVSYTNLIQGPFWHYSLELDSGRCRNH
ncbi:uncharacterized protein LOC119546722 isoform X2 [Drosophila subpulchrella]|uniref:uncharacterized protein LOC119546722 isoform X2 n=1 Tax=Drosophila subpulchrella TaxID=1486046 RepID=UPI0018A16892|nr:uncharacterized protein LOC119546722 isoform X2 [Drosophila subpulchrella]